MFHYSRKQFCDCFDFFSKTCFAALAIVLGAAAASNAARASCRHY
jgi:hypothetical protein